MGPCSDSSLCPGWAFVKQRRASLLFSVSEEQGAWLSRASGLVGCCGGTDVQRRVSSRFCWFSSRLRRHLGGGKPEALLGFFSVS